MSYTICNVDRLSSLPEEVHSHILSLMPTKFAVRTSILSRTWRYKWTLVTNLDFDDSHPFHDLGCFMKFVDRVLELQKLPQVKLFRMCFTEMWVKKTKVSKWIDAAVRLNVSELDVKAILLEFPLCLFTCRTLTKLRIDDNTCNEDWECPSPVNLLFLKTLDIVVFANPFVNAFKLIPGCPLLESLSLEVKWCNDQNDYIFNIPTLKRLKLTFQKGRLVNSKAILHIPNLEHLLFDGGSIFVMEDMPSLVEASIQYAPLTSSLPVFPNLNHLELKSFELSFLESSPMLKHLCIEVPTYSHWVAPKSVPECMLTSLTTIKILHCNGKDSNIQLLEYLLGNANVLKTVTITWGYLCMDTEEQMRLASHLLKVPRAYRDCEIHFLSLFSPFTASQLAFAK